MPGAEPAPPPPRSQPCLAAKLPTLPPPRAGRRLHPEGPRARGFNAAGGNFKFLVILSFHSSVLQQKFDRTIEHCWGAWSVSSPVVPLATDTSFSSSSAPYTCPRPTAPPTMMAMSWGCWEGGETRFLLLASTPSRYREWERE